MSIQIGSRLGSYDVISLLGAGGMGEVYRARDSRLRREVAIKVMLDAANASAEGRLRFEQEARAASALNHPNIVIIYDIGVEDGCPYIVSELIDGYSLRALIQKGPVSLKKFLDVAVQIADALAAAHAAGITHRDLKPENIMLGRNGRVKILDFGLAKTAVLLQTDTTVTQPVLTEAGITVGTIPYMSPEQARGASADYRSDQFSLGIVFHELLAGEHPFRRPSAAETLSAIIKEDAPPLDPALPAHLHWILDRLLAKDPDERYGSTKDLHRDLLNLRGFSGTTSTAAVRAVPKRNWKLVLLAAGLAAVSLAAGVFVAASFRTAPAELRFTPISRESFSERNPAWSKDGKSIAYQGLIRGVHQIFTRSLESPVSAQLTHGNQNCTWPFFSPDAATIYYTAAGALWAVPAAGGSSRRVLENATSPALSPDGGTIYFARDNRLYSGPFPNGPFQPNEGFTHRAVSIRCSFDGRRLAVLANPESTGAQLELWLVPLPSGEPRKLRPPANVTGMSWFPDGRLVLQLQTGPQAGNFTVLDVATNKSRPLFSCPVLCESPALSSDGKRIAYYGGEIDWDLLEIGVPDASVRPLLVRSGADLTVDWAPSGTHYAFATDTRGRFELWDRSLSDGFVRVLLTTGTEGPFSSPLMQYSQPHWSPDGERLVFLAQLISISVSGLNPQLYLLNANGGKPVLLDHDAELSEAPAWSPDGQWIAYRRLKAGHMEIVKINPGTSSPAVTLTTMEAGSEFRREQTASSFRAFTQWSPRGEQILYRAEAGLFVISEQGGTAHRLSSRSPLAAAYSKDGATIYAIVQNQDFRLPEWQLVMIDAQSGAERGVKTVSLPPTASILYGFSMHPDGRRIATSIGQWRFDIWMIEGF